MTRDHYRPFISALLIIAGLYFALLVSGCSTFQRQAKQGSDERNHCWLYSQLCTTARRRREALWLRLRRLPPVTCCSDRRFNFLQNKYQKSFT
jgi:hypothetical protein